MGGGLVNLQRCVGWCVGAPSEKVEYLIVPDIVAPKLGMPQGSCTRHEEGFVSHHRACNHWVDPS